MKKIEASLIKRLMRISGKDLVSSVLELSHYSLSLSRTLGYIGFSWSTLGGCGILGLLEQEGKGRARKHNKASASTTTSDFLVGTELHV